MHRVFLPLVVAIAWSSFACWNQVVVADDGPPQLAVWPGRPPGLAADAALENKMVMHERIGRRVERVNKPLLTVYRPPQDSANTGAAVVVCPGGGYNILALDLEGKEVADWLTGIGVTAVVLQYRVPRAKDEPHHVPPLRDAQRTIRLCRAHAKEWGIDPQRIGIMGFSAGGHLSAAAATNHQKPAYDDLDDVDKLSCRPDFAMLIYPAYMTDKRESLQLSEELPVDKQTPPALLIHTGDDGVPATNSVAYYLALRRAGVPAELHIYPKGGHGYGLRPTENAVSSWPERAGRWMKTMGLLAPAN